MPRKRPVRSLHQKKAVERTEIIYAATIDQICALAHHETLLNGGSKSEADAAAISMRKALRKIIDGAVLSGMGAQEDLDSGRPLG